MKIRRRRATWLLAVAICALALPSAALAERHRGGGGKHYGGGGKHHGGGHSRSYSGRRHGGGRHYSRHSRRHYRGNRHRSYYGHHYYRYGSWYSPYRYGYGFIVAPLGTIVRILPPYYTTAWVYGVPYYYANSTYYTWSEPDNGYLVVADPGIGVSEPIEDELFIYPNVGQSEELQADDRYACHRWAADQTGYDPSRGGASDGESTRPELRSDYQRARTACLEGRDYTVK